MKIDARNITNTQKAIRICKGDKVAPLDNTEKSCQVLADELEKLGYKTQVGKNMESGRWSVAILNDIE